MDKDLKKCKETLITNSAELLKQMESVAKKYPLVALAIKLQQAQLADRAIEDIDTLRPFTLDTDTLARIQAEYQARKRRRERCLGNAQTSQDALQCLQDYPVI